MIRSINLLYLCFFSKMGILLPYLAAYYRSVGIPETMLGYLFAIFAIVNSLAPIAWGAIGDRLRSVKLNLAINFGGAFISLFTLFLTDNFYWILLSVAASSFFMSGVQPILDATAISIEKKTGHPYEKMRIYGSVGILSACLLTGWLIERYSIDIALPVVSLLYVFIGIVTITHLPNTPNESKTESKISTKKIFNILRKKEFFPRFQE